MLSWVDTKSMVKLISTKEKIKGLGMSQVNWVKLEKFCDMTGYSRKSVYALIDRGRWMLSREYRKVGRRIHISLQAYERWVEQDGQS